MTRQNINSKNVVTRLYVYGGSSNLGDKYRYTRLCLPGKAKNASYIEDAAAIAAYGLKENTKIFDDIKPERYVAYRRSERKGKVHYRKLGRL